GVGHALAVVGGADVAGVDQRLAVGGQLADDHVLRGRWDRRRGRRGAGRRGGGPPLGHNGGFGRGGRRQGRGGDVGAAGGVHGDAVAGPRDGADAELTDAAAEEGGVDPLRGVVAQLLHPEDVAAGRAEGGRGRRGHPGEARGAAVAGEVDVAGGVE